MEPSRSSPERQEEARSSPTRVDYGSPERSLDRKGSMERIERRENIQEKPVAQRTESLPPRRPPPPAPIQQRLVRAQSQTTAYRTHDPPQVSYVSTYLKEATHLPIAMSLLEPAKNFINVIPYKYKGSMCFVMLYFVLHSFFRHFISFLNASD